MSTAFAAATLGWGVAVAISLTWMRARARRRTFELRTTKDALTAHYNAMDRIVDDPALPLSALEFLQHFAAVTSDRDFCEELTSGVLRVAPDDLKRAGTPRWQEDVDALRKTRPDLARDFHTAVSSGIVAMFLRWPGNSWKLQALMQQIAADSRQEAIIAEQLAHGRKHRNGKNGGPIVPGGLVPV